MLTPLRTITDTEHVDRFTEAFQNHLATPAATEEGPILVVRARKTLIVTNGSGMGMLPGCPKPKNLSGSTPCCFRT